VHELGTLRRSCCGVDRPHLAVRRKQARMAADVAGLDRICKERAPNSRKWMPELHLIVAWVGSLLGFLYWLQPVMDLVDLAVVLGIYLICLPIIHPSSTPRLMACLGGPICGFIGGMQLIDLCFDLCILRDRSISDGFDDFQARRVAFLYYHTVITAPHVNGVLLCIIVTAFLGSMVGLGRSSPALLRHWLMLGAAMFVGTGGYLTCVVPRYLVIRMAKAFEPSLFDGWEMVLAARLVLYISLILAMPFMFALQGMRDDGGSSSELGHSKDS